MDKMVRVSDTWEIKKSSKRSDKEMYNKIRSVLEALSIN